MFQSYSFYFILSFVGFMMIYFIKKRVFERENSSATTALNLEQIDLFLKEHGGNHASHLLFLKDKDIYWAAQDKVLLVYKRIGNKLIVLGDPVGEEGSIKAAIKEFYQYCEGKGLKPVFYQISSRYMHYFHETGFRFVKLGEEGRVNLDNFSLAGKQGAKLRTRINKFTRNSYTFNVIHPPYSKELLVELKAVSDTWLGNQKEKGFSVVSFSEEYILSFPIALLMDPEGNIIAFATLATDYKKTISIDLMRKTSDSPHGTMDVLFIHIFNWAKENNYQTCSLGMAPFSNVGKCQSSFITEKLIRLAYKHGNSIYKFKGLKEFKSKFACGWDPKYLAYRKSFLPITFIQLYLLINTQPNSKEIVVDKVKGFIKKVG